MAVKMDGSHQVQRFAHTHTDIGAYTGEAHAVPSPDGRRILWDSTWSRSCVNCGSTSDVKPYITDARALVNGSDTIPPSAITDLQIYQ